MGPNNSFSKLDIELPPLPPGCAYRLLPAGPIGYFSGTELRIAAQFQPVKFLRSGTRPQGLPVECTVSITHAGVLRAGSLWDANGQLVDGSESRSSCRHTLTLGMSPLSLARVRDLFAPGNRPVLPWGTPPADMWLAVVKQGGQRVLIPCFELLRAFYYQDGAKLISFFFSQLPLSTLCRALVTPSRANGHCARMCVATEQLPPGPARVVAELLFSPAYRRTLQQAHTRLALHGRQANGPVYPATALHLGREVRTWVTGVPFLAGGVPHVWGEAVIPQESFFSFRTLVYHPITQDSFPRPDEALCSDVLTALRSGRHHRTKEVRLSALPAERSPAVRWPPVTCGRPWARQQPPSAPLVFLDEAPALPWPATGSHDLGAPRLALFNRALQALEAVGYRVQRLRLNNPGRRFGAAVSVALHQGFLPLREETFADPVYRVGLALLTRGTRSLYLVQPPQEPWLVLAWKENWAVLQPAESNILLEVLLETHLRRLFPAYYLVPARHELPPSEEHLVVSPLVGCRTAADAVAHCRAYVEQGRPVYPPYPYPITTGESRQGPG